MLIVLLKSKSFKPILYRLKTNLQIALEAFQVIEQHLVWIKRILWMGGMLALGTAPIFLYMSADLPTPPLRQSAIYYLLVLSAYLMYGSFTYRKLVYLNRYFRLEQRFLHHHQAEDGLWQTLQNPENIWAPSYTFQFLRVSLKRYLPDEPNTEKKTARWKVFLRKKAEHPLLPVEHFDQTLGQLCLPWVNLSIAFWASMAWIMYRTPSRIPDLIWQNYAGWFAASAVVLLIAFAFEIWGIYKRIGLYQAFPRLREGVMGFSMDVLQTVPNLLPDWTSPLADTPQKVAKEETKEVLHLQQIGKQTKSKPQNLKKKKNAQTPATTPWASPDPLANKEVVKPPKPEEVPNLFIPLDVLLTLPTAEVSLEPEPSSLSEHFMLTVTPEQPILSEQDPEPDTEAQSFAFETDPEPDTLTDDWLPVPIYGGKPMTLPQPISEEDLLRMPERRWGDSLSVPESFVQDMPQNPKEVIFIGKLSSNASGQAVLTMQPIGETDPNANSTLDVKASSTPSDDTPLSDNLLLPTFSSLADLV